MTSYCHKPIVQRWNTPSSWRWWWCWRQRGWRSDRGDFSSVSPSNLRWNGLCFCLSCFSAASDCDCIRSIYIGIVRSSSASRDKDWRCWRLEARTTLGGTAWQGPAPPVLIWPLDLNSLSSSSLGASRDKILMLQKSQVNLSPGRSLKLKNTQNRVSLSCRVITKIRRVDGKSP
jgi:hypothetical protein